MPSGFNFKSIDPRERGREHEETRGCKHCSWQPWEKGLWAVWGCLMALAFFTIVINLTGGFAPINVQPTCGDQIPTGYGTYKIARFGVDDCVKPSPPPVNSPSRGSTSR